VNRFIYLYYLIKILTHTHTHSHSSHSRTHTRTHTQVIEIPTLTEHLLSECEVKNTHKECPRCAEAVPNLVFDQHVAAASCKRMLYICVCACMVCVMCVCVLVLLFFCANNK